MHFGIKLLIALICGVALSFAQSPYGLWVLIFPCFGLFYWLYQSLEKKRTVFLLSFVFSIGYFIAGLNWIGNALLVEGNEFKWVWPLAVIALPTLLALFPALYLTINHLLLKKALPRFVGFCVFLAFSEWVRGYAFTGFPWNLYGYAPASNLKIAQSLSLFGPYGLTFLTIFWGASLAYQGQCKKIIWAISLTSLIVIYGYGHLRLSQNPTQYNESYEFHLIQPNIAQAQKWESDYLRPNFNAHYSLSNRPRDENKRHIFIWPETAIPPILVHDPDVNNHIQSLVAENALLLSGTLTAEMGIDTNKPRYHNALSAWSAEKTGQRIYAKSHLVPFGEYIPFQQFIPLQTVTQFNGFSRGQGAQTVTIDGYPSFSPLICYEIIFPHKSISKAHPRPDYILNVTNDAWYGDSAGPRQHFQQARFRAIEQGIPVMRAANTGISGTIGAYGRMSATSDLLKIQTVKSKLPLKTASRTPYGKLGDAPFLSLLIMLLGVCYILDRRK